MCDQRCGVQIALRDQTENLHAVAAIDAARFKGQIFSLREKRIAPKGMAGLSVRKDVPRRTAAGKIRRLFVTLRALSRQVWVNRYAVTEWKASPAFSRVEGNSGWLGLSGKNWVSMQKPWCR